MRINQRRSDRGGADGAGPSTSGTRLTSTKIAAGSAAAYAVVHSWLLTPPAEALAAHVFGGGTHRWYRLLYNVLAIALLELQDALVARLPDRQLYAASGAWRRALSAASWASLVGLGLCVRHTDAAHFLGVRQSGWFHSWMERHPRHLVESGRTGWCDIRVTGACWVCSGCAQLLA
jgi:hypothetical protein